MLDVEFYGLYNGIWARDLMPWFFSDFCDFHKSLPCFFAILAVIFYCPYRWTKSIVNTPYPSQSRVKVDLSPGGWSGPSRGGERGERFPGPRRFGASPSLKNTEKGVSDGFSLTSNMHKIHFRPGLRPGARWKSLRRSPRPLVKWWRDTPPHVSSLSTPCSQHVRELW